MKRTFLYLIFSFTLLVFRKPFSLFAVDWIGSRLWLVFGCNARTKNGFRALAVRTEIAFAVSEFNRAWNEMTGNKLSFAKKYR
jgi:hypothetical protein